MSNKSGYNASMRIGSYAGASLTNVAISISGETVDVTDLADTWRARARGCLDWEVTATKNIDTLAFLGIMTSGARALPSVTVTVYDTTGTASANRIFVGVGFPTRASVTLPMGAATEEITIQAKQAPTLP
ncbi:MAG: hypothetical protein WC998_06000 [Candidatus Paceibacterota bacterium]